MHKLELYADSGNRTITGNDGNTYTVGEARELMAQGKVFDMNQSLARLMTHYDGDWDALHAFYEEMSN